MDQKIARDDRTTPDLLDHHQTTREQQSEPEQRKTLEHEFSSDQGTPRDQQTAPTPAGNEEALHQHQRHLYSAYPSFDLSEVSSHTENTAFPGSRHSSLNTEPLTLDADQLHGAKDEAVDVLERVDTETAFDIFTKDLQTESEEAPTQETAQALADHINSLVEKAQQVVEATGQQQLQSVNKTTGGASDSTVEGRNGPGNPTGSLEEDVKRKAE